MKTSATRPYGSRQRPDSPVAVGLGGHRGAGQLQRRQRRRQHQPPLVQRGEPVLLEGPRPSRRPALRTRHQGLSIPARHATRRAGVRAGHHLHVHAHRRDEDLRHQRLQLGREHLPGRHRHPRFALQLHGVEAGGHGLPGEGDQPFGGGVRRQGQRRHVRRDAPGAGIRTFASGALEHFGHEGRVLPSAEAPDLRPGEPYAYVAVRGQRSEGRQLEAAPPVGEGLGHVRVGAPREGTRARQTQAQQRGSPRHHRHLLATSQRRGHGGHHQRCHRGPQAQAPPLRGLAHHGVEDDLPVHRPGVRQRLAGPAQRVEPQGHQRRPRARHQRHHGRPREPPARRQPGLTAPRPRGQRQARRQHEQQSHAGQQAEDSRPRGLPQRRQHDGATVPRRSVLHRRQTAVDAVEHAQRTRDRRRRSQRQDPGAEGGLLPGAQPQQHAARHRDERSDRQHAVHGPTALDEGVREASPADAVTRGQRREGQQEQRQAQQGREGRQQAEGQGVSGGSGGHGRPIARHSPPRNLAVAKGRNRPATPGVEGSTRSRRAAEAAVLLRAPFTGARPTGAAA